MKNIKMILSIMVMGIIMVACKKDSSSSTTQYSVKMTDAPGPYNAVYIDLQGVEVIGSDGNAITLNSNNRIYNLINLSNGVDTLIATGSLSTSSVQQIRLILGTNNSVVVNHVSYPLSTPSADQSGLKIQVHQTLQAGVQYAVLLDFDANQSIVDHGNGTYSLKPVVNSIDVTISGSIKGTITPAGTLAVVTATSTTTGIAYSTNVSTNGGFMIKGTPSGTYIVTITPLFPLNPIIKTNVMVTTGVSELI